MGVRLFNMASMKIDNDKITIDGVEYSHKFSEEIDPDPTNLDAELIKQSSMFAFYGSMAVKAHSRAKKIKNRLEVVYANLDQEKRAAAMAQMRVDPKLKFTEVMYEHMIITDSRYQELKLELLDAEEVADILDVWRDSMSSRREMLKQLAENSRLGEIPNRVLIQQAAHVKNMFNKGTPAVIQEVTIPDSSTQNSSRRRNPKSE